MKGTSGLLEATLEILALVILVMNSNATFNLYIKLADAIPAISVDLRALVVQVVLFSV